MIAAWLWACGTSSPPEPDLPAPTHANGWDDLVAAVDRGDVPTSRVLARDLTLAGVGEDSPWATRLGGALGMLQVADEQDLRDAAEAAASACDGCHRERGLGQVTHPLGPTTP
ncbi:MAG: hypothetical protein H6738_11495 [Alphaproteobacteria bacterium]|nr:hypothetical protein [Alphaproteobacteria bacterium]MCB9697395.1 hypothetical protein [Alphaproteobacteria bacterium]